MPARSARRARNRHRRRGPRASRRPTGCAARTGCARPARRSCAKAPRAACGSAGSAAISRAVLDGSSQSGPRRGDLADAALEQQVRRLVVAALGGEPVGVLEQRQRLAGVGRPLGRGLRGARGARADERREHAATADSASDAAPSAISTHISAWPDSPSTRPSGRSASPIGLNSQPRNSRRSCSQPGGSAAARAARPGRTGCRRRRAAPASRARSASALVRRGDLPPCPVVTGAVVAWPAQRAQRELRLNRARSACAVGAEHAQFLAVERQLLERAVDRRIARRADDVGVEHRRREARALLVAFELGHVDAVGGEAAERLVERGGDVLHLEHEGGHRRSRRRAWPDRARSRASTTKRVVLSLRVLDLVLDDLEAVELGGQRRGDRARRADRPAP